MEDAVYKRIDTRELRIHLHFPGDWREEDRRPAIVFFFGGGWYQGSVEQFYNQAQYLATRGMVAARADYRVRSRDGVGPADCVEDAKSAVRWVRANHARLGIDPDRIVAAGGSAGGHIATCTALTPGLDAPGEDHSVSSQPQALVLFNPVVSLLEAPCGIERVNDDEALARLISPNERIRPGAPPAILFYGTSDEFLSQGENFVAKSRAAGNRADMDLTEGQAHAFFNAAPYWQRTLAVADRFLADLGYLEGDPTIDSAEDTKEKRD